MLINIIFISKQTKIADFHTLYIMRCRHPKETATLKKNRNVTPTAFLTHRHLRAGQFKSSSTNSTRAIPFGPLEKAGRHRRSPPHFTNFPTLRASPASATPSPCRRLRKQHEDKLPQRNPTVQTASRHPNLGHPPDSKPP